MCILFQVFQCGLNSVEWCFFQPVIISLYSLSLKIIRYMYEFDKFIFSYGMIFFSFGKNTHTILFTIIFFNKQGQHPLHTLYHKNKTIKIINEEKTKYITKQISKSNNSKHHYSIFNNLTT